MSQDKVLLRIEQKLDALLGANGIDASDFGEAGGKKAARPTPQLTPAQQEAINNAPKYIEAKPAGSQPPIVPNPEEAADLHKATLEEANAAGLSDEEAKTAEVAVALPWEGYDAASSEDIIKRLRGMDTDAREKALAYERKNKNRVTITRVNWTS